MRSTARGALLAVLEDDTPMNELAHALAAGGFAGTPESTARFVSMIIGRGWATLATNTWPGPTDASVVIDAEASRLRIVNEAAHDPCPADGLVLIATDTLESVVWQHLRRRPVHPGLG
jgi:hypothetical protein